jgi:hypothetical protein
MVYLIEPPFVDAWEAQAVRDGLSRDAAYWPGRLDVDRRGARAAGEALAAAVPACAEYSDESNQMVTTRHRLRVQIHAGGPP